MPQVIAAAYLRKSNDEGAKDAEAKSVARQRERARAYAESKGWTLDERYVFEDDAISGAEFLKRPGFAALMDAAGAKPRPAFQVLIVAEQSRIGRDAILTLAAMKTITDAGVRIFSYLEDRELKLEGSDLIVRMVGGWSDEDTITKTSLRVADQKLSAIAAGRVAGGKVYGYRNVREAKGRTVRVIREDEAQVVRRVFELTAAGQGLKRIVNALNAEGVPGPRYDCPSRSVDPLHEHGDACKRQPWETVGLREVLRRELYRGVVVYGRTKRTRKGGTKGRTKDVDAEHIVRQEQPELRIISEELWAAAHARIARTVGQYQRKGRLVAKVETTKGAYMLSGMIACGICKAKLVATKRGRANMKVYICAGHRDKGPSVCANSSGVPMSLLHAGVVTSLRESLTPEALRDYIERRAADTAAQDALEREHAHLVDTIGKLREQEARLADLIAGGTSLDAVVLKLRGVQAERELQESRLVKVEEERRELRADSDLLTQLQQSLPSWLEALEGDPMEARRRLRSILKSPIFVIPEGSGRQTTWTFMGVSHLDGILLGGISQGEAKSWVPAADGWQRAVVSAVKSGLQAARMAKPISGGSDCGPDLGAPDMAPTPGPQPAGILRVPFSGRIVRR